MLTQPRSPLQPSSQSSMTRSEMRSSCGPGLFVKLRAIGADYLAQPAVPDTRSSAVLAGGVLQPHSQISMISRGERRAGRGVC